MSIFSCFGAVENRQALLSVGPARCLEPQPRFITSEDTSFHFYFHLLVFWCDWLRMFPIAVKNTL